MDAARCLGRPARWWRTRIVGLLTAPPAVAPDGTVLPATRLGWALNPPQPAKTDRR